MAQNATVNYHVHKPEQQAFYLDSDGIVGNLISPELVEKEVTVADVRNPGNAASFQVDSVGFAHVPSAVHAFDRDNAWQAAYDAELTTLLRGELGAREVVIFDHTVRVDDPNAVRKPARNVHSDYSVDGAKQRLADILGVERSADWNTGHYAFINIWRPIGDPINSAPLGFIRPSTVDDKDWILLDLIYPDRKGQIMGLAANPRHEWIYQSRMTSDEVAFFNIYDNRGRPSIGHSALDMVEDPDIQAIRKSIESRTLVRY